MRTIANQTVRVADLIVFDHEGPWLRDLELNSCVLLGPAVLLLASGHITFTDGTIEQAQLWPIDDTNRIYIGAIGIDGCAFHGCSFQDIGFAGERDFIDRFFVS